MINPIAISEEQLKTIWPTLNQNQKDALAKELSFVARQEKCDLYDKDVFFSEWAMSWFYIPETNAPIYLYPHQRKAIDLATSKNEDGLFKYSLVHYGDIKKSGKTTIAAMVALRFAFMRNWASIKVIGQKLDQAKSRSYYYITRALDINPVFAKMQQDGEIIINKYTIYIKKTNSIIQAIPASPSTEAGGNDDCIIWTEIGSAKTEAAQVLWSEMVIPPRKYGCGIKWVEGYAGRIGEAPILEKIYNTNVQDDFKVDDSPPLYVNGRTFVMWNETPRLQNFQTKDYYRQQSSELTESEFRRIHKNEWVSSESQFIDPVQWDLCQGQIPPLKPKEKLILALDVGLSNDCFAIIGVNKIRGKIAVRTVKVWIPKKGEKLHFTNPTSDKGKDKDYPYGYLEWLSKQFKIITLRYDPYQAEKLAEDLIRNRICACEPFSQQSEREKSDKYLYDLIREQNIIHDGNTILTAHIKNANAQNKGENKLRLIKRNEAKKIDSAVALSMASYTCKDYRL